MEVFGVLIVTVIAALFYVYWSFKKSYSYFECHGVPYLKPNFFFGNMADAILLRKSLSEVYREIYNNLASHKFGGVYVLREPTFIIRDPELVKNVLVKDFAYFCDRGISVNPEVDPLRCTLFHMKGEQWRTLRTKLTSSFNISKMKMMFPLIKDCGEKLNQVVNQLPVEGPFDVKELSARYTTDSIGTCAFGFETRSLENPNSEFRLMGKKIFKFRYRAILRTLWPNMPLKLVKLLKLTYLEDTVQRFFIEIVNNAVKYREEKKILRYDFLDLLIAIKNNTVLEKYHGSDDVKDEQKFLKQVGDRRMKNNINLSPELLAAQCFTFFTSGYGPSCTTLGYLMFELSQNPEIQNKVRREIRTVLENFHGELTFEAMKEMTYADMVIAETMRKYPPVTFLFRECSKNYKIPDSDVVIPAKTSVIIPVYGMQWDEKYYDNPQEFRPERFTEEEKAKRPNYTYLPFGDGPKGCMGECYAKVQMKLGLIYMLKDSSYRLSTKTKLPLQFKKDIGFLTVGNIWLHRQRI